MADGQSYPVDNVNKVKRVYERGRYDYETVHKLLDLGMMCHVSYVIDGQPYCTPTLYWREGTRLYWHGSSASRMLRNLSEGEPACLTVSFLDSLVLARCGFNHSVDYRAVMCFGKARLVEDQAEKEQALVMMVDRFFPGRTAQIRQSSKKEIKATGVLYMDIEKASAKIRAKGIGDEEEDYLLPIYAERVPVYQTLGEPQACDRLLEGVTRPDSLSMYTAGKPLEDAVLEAYEVSYPGSYPELAKKA